MRMSHRKIHQNQGERHLGCHYDGILRVRHLNSSPNLLLLLGTSDVLSKCFFLIIVIIIEECKLWTIKWFPSTTTTPLFQPSCISSRHYTSPDQWCHPVGMVASNAIMSYLDVRRCKRVSGLVPWFWCIVSLHPSSKCPLPNERVVLVDSMGGRAGRWEYIDGWFRRETLADMSLKEVGGGCSLNYWCCSLMVSDEWTMEAWGCWRNSLMKMSGTKQWLT